MSNATKLALVGCGGISAVHVRAYRDLHERGCQDFEIAACCDVARDKAEEKAEEIAAFQGKKPEVFGSVGELVQSAVVEAADLCLPHAFHHSTAIELLEGGVHVLLEKPLGITIKASRKIIAAAEKAGKIIATAENIRRMPGPRACRWALSEAKLIGEVFAVHLNHNQYGPFDYTHPGMKWRGVKLLTGGGMIMDSGAHLTDMMVYMFGEPDEVYCRMATLDASPIKDAPRVGDVTVDSEDTWQAIISFKSGVQFNWTYSRTFPGAELTGGHYFGATGSMLDHGMVMHPFQTGGSLVEADGTVRAPEWVEDKYMESLSEEEKENLFPYGATDGFSIEVFDFIRAIRTGQPVEMDGEAGLLAKTMCMACYESASAGSVVKYDDVLSGKISAYQDPIDAYWDI